MVGSNSSEQQKAIPPFDRAASLINLDKDVRDVLARPRHELAFSFPAKMADGRAGPFAGYWVQHDNRLGPCKGGLCCHPKLSIDEVRARARHMTWKSALASLPFGGAYGGIRIDPTRYSAAELERIAWWFCSFLDNSIGPGDTRAPSAVTSPQNVACILDTCWPMLSSPKRQQSLHVVTGNPIELGGSVDRDKATGQGIVHAIAHWAQDRGLNLNQATYIIQGFGDVGLWTARRLKAVGAILVAVEDHTCALANPDGIDPDELLAYTVTHEGGIAGYPQARTVAHRSFLNTRADILIPAALEKQITRTTAPWLNVRLVAEGTNHPTDLEGDFVLQARGIDLLPDILCTSGGVIHSYLEWLQNKCPKSGERGEVDARLYPIITGAYRRVADAVKLYQTDWRTAAHVVALTRLVGEDAHEDFVSHCPGAD